MTKNLVCLFLALGLPPLAVGCGGSSAVGAEKAPAEAKKTQELPAPPPPQDPLVADAARVKQEIGKLEDDLLERLDAVRGVIASAKADLARLRRSADQFAKLTQELWQKTRQLSEALNTLSDKTAELSRSSKHLDTSYRALADLFRKKAADYAEPKLRARVLAFAADYEAFAGAVPERCRELDLLQAKIPRLKQKVAELNAFLADALQFMAAHPGLGSDPRDQVSAEFEAFAVEFTAWLGVLDELRTALRERAVSKGIQESRRKDEAQRKADDAKEREKSEDDPE